MNIEEAKSRTGGINVKGIIRDKRQRRWVDTKYGPNYVSDAYLEDYSGRIKFSIWQDDEPLNNGDRILVENGYTLSWRDEIQLAVGKFNGKIIRIVGSKKYGSSTQTKKEKHRKVGITDFRNWKNYVSETVQSRTDGKRSDAYLDSLVEEFGNDWEMYSASGKGSKIVQMFEGVFNHEFAQRQKEHEAAEKEQKRRFNDDQEREEKPKQTGTSDLSKYYKILELTQNATDEQIKRRFRERVLDEHPDRGGDSEMFKKLHEAREILLKHKKKK